MFGVMGASGNTGRVVAEELLKAGKDVRVIVRDPAKGASWAARGCEVAVAEQTDAAALTAAFRGLEGVYLLVAPDLATTDFFGRARKVIGAYHAALQAASVPHAAFLSSVGAQHEAGTGPIRALHDGEGAFAGAKTQVTAVRAAYFMENLGMLVGAVTHQGVLPSFWATDLAIPMVATQDIGRTAADALLHPPAASRAVELAGPREYSFEDAARIFGAVLGKEVQAVRVPDEAILPALTAAGVSEHMGEIYREMSIGIGSGHVAFEGGACPLVRGTVGLDALVAALLK